MRLARVVENTYERCVPDVHGPQWRLGPNRLVLGHYHLLQRAHFLDLRV